MSGSGQAGGAGKRRCFLQVYTGNGKGKTTAALGLALRAVCAGLRVFIGQFMKGLPYSESHLPSLLGDALRLEQFGTPRLLCKGETPSDEDLALARQGLERIIEVLRGRQYDLVVADEFCVTIHLGLLRVEDGLRLADARPDDVELVLTGRYAPPELILRADLVTEMKEIKHYYQQGVMARKGFDR